VKEAMRMSVRRPVYGVFLSVAAAALGWASSSCAPTGFLDQTQIESVRIIASAADKPYAQPGDTVTVSVLAFDARPVKPEPMTLYWLPFVCENPADDAYYACFEQIAKGSASASPSSPDGGAPGGGGFAPGIDLTPLLSVGPTFTFQVPADAITTHPVVAGQGTPYGLVVLFNVACAGHLETVAFDNGNPQQPPIGCFDSNHNALGPDDWVFGFTRVYAYATATNANPVISRVDEGPGRTIASGQFFEPPPPPPAVFSAESLDGTLVLQHCSNGCPKVPIGPVVPPSSQEVETQMGPGFTGKEEIWADFYSTLGTFDDDARLLYDPSIGSLGAPSATDNNFNVPSDPGDGFIWIVVHDNRGGASWVTVPVHVE
jgi:hypothetical protein